MKTTLQRLGGAVNSFIYCIGVIFLASYAIDHWPRPAAFAFWGFLALFATHSIWSFVIQPFRVGLRGE